MNAPAQFWEIMTGRKAELIPGVYPNVPEDEYFRWKAVSHSKLSPMAGKTPAHCKYAMDHPKERTDAMTLGSAVDCLVLSPTLFNDRFAVAEQCAAMTLKAERCSKTGVIRLNSVNPHWYCSQHATGKTIENLPYTKLTPDQSSTAYAMAKSVLDHPGASVLLAACEETQLSLVWRENNLLCKGRLDGLSSELKTVIDLKTCADASPEAFSRKIADFGYHRQAAMYLRGCSYHGIDVQNYVIIAVENEPPHAVALYTLTESVPSGVVWSPKSQLSPVEYGNHELLRLLDLYEHCEATGEWPSYPEKPVPISLPVWVSQRIERE